MEQQYAKPAELLAKAFIEAKKLAAGLNYAEINDDGVTSSEVGEQHTIAVSFNSGTYIRVTIIKGHSTKVDDDPET
jgi:hypothetical protein